MKHLSLAAKYRPQTFAQVAGQDMVKAVLSRAAAEDRVAAAYLLSGTRGVGKTTIARIFAKALNCRHAPGPEPCNQCDQCRKITQGSHVDVTEIDGASNNSVEDARALRENIGYAPMEGRYKVFIIDEAHMLSRSAFNALLKTLEEPPARVVFIFATTEAHKFPVTIISRCQHFVFRHLGEDALVQHLSQVLNRENVPFEEGAVRLIARRAAGSVRDSMSLLDQTLALGGDHLTSAVAREVLGLAGQELFADLFDALHARDCAAVSQLCAGLFRQGVDIGFFVRELAGHLRDLFLLRQGGEAVAPSLGLPGEELLFWQGLAPRFSAGHLHAAWQMVLDAQRGIVQNPEPAAALELLLLNLALLPQLLPLERMDSLPAPAEPVQGHPGHDRQDGSGEPAPSRSPGNGARPHRETPARRSAARPARVAEAAAPEAARPQAPEHVGPSETDMIEADDIPAAAPVTPAGPARSAAPAAPVAPPAPATAPVPTAVPAPEAPPAAPAAAEGFRPDWQAFCDFCARRLENGEAAPQLHLLRQLRASWEPDCLRLTPRAETLLHQTEKQRPQLEQALAAWGAGHLRLEFVAPRQARTEAELIEEFRNRPEMQACLRLLDATIEHCTESNQGDTHA
ncbi:DNA polymerase III subunit gamma/tau [uncultured Desulfovibrio sp.]|uniref:DNA polymerase III subunit gamma/tau n=1 Tax=uncultured Desulfovibrio sp. TaxID=167968 RepID=UPI0025F170C1|nr:DNA polymerase III subunit gamma/tau [uncultured Desulfovibrio sp.]